MDPILQKLIDDCGLIEGRDEGDYYFQRGKCIVKQPGALKIQRKIKAEMEGPPDIKWGPDSRIVMSGWWSRPLLEVDPDGGDPKEVGRQRHWTTGEAWGSKKSNSGKSQPENTHPAALAEKRWRVRGILGLVMDPQLSGILYGEEEMPDDWLKEKKPEPQSSEPIRQKHDAPRQAPSGPAGPTDEAMPEWAAKLPSEWSAMCGEVCEITGLERAEFEQHLYRHLAAFEGDKGWVVPSVKYRPTFADLCKEKPKWALNMKKNDEKGWEIWLGRLRSGETWTINTFQWSQNRTRWELGNPFHLVPKGGSAPSGGDIPTEDYDPDDVPF